MQAYVVSYDSGNIMWTHSEAMMPHGNVIHRVYGAMVNDLCSYGDIYYKDPFTLYHVCSRTVRFYYM